MEEEKSVIDDLDQRIILELQKDGRISYAEMAQNFGISIPTISRRMERLLNEGIIRITAIPDTKKIGYNAYALIGLKVKLNKLEEICATLVEHTEVYYTAVTFGRFDVIISAYFPTSEMIMDFVKKELSLIDGVLQIETFVVSEVKKRDFGWLRHSKLSRMHPYLRTNVK